MPLICHIVVKTLKLSYIVLWYCQV